VLERCIAKELANYKLSENKTLGVSLFANYRLLQNYCINPEGTRGTDN